MFERHGATMSFKIEFFQQTPAQPQGAGGERLEAFASRRAAVAFALRHRPTQASGFRLYKDGTLLRIMSFDDGGSEVAEDL